MRTLTTLRITLDNCRGPSTLRNYVSSIMKRRNRTEIKPLRAIVVSRTNRVADHLRSSQLTAYKMTTARTTVKIIIVRIKIDLLKANAYQTRSIAIV